MADPDTSGAHPKVSGSLSGSEPDAVRLIGPPELAVISVSGEIAGNLLSAGDDSNGLFNALAKFSLPPVVVVTFNREALKASYLAGFRITSRIFAALAEGF